MSRPPGPWSQLSRNHVVRLAASPVDSPVSVSGDGGNDGQSAPVLVVVLVGGPPAASVGNLNPRVVTGVERRPNGERPSGVTRPAVQDGVGREFGG